MAARTLAAAWMLVGEAREKQLSFGDYNTASDGVSYAIGDRNQGITLGSSQPLVRDSVFAMTRKKICTW